jgi:hypothetical protein
MAAADRKGKQPEGSGQSQRTEGDQIAVAGVGCSTEAGVWEAGGNDSRA